MAHAWKACWVHALAGSNPASSAAVSSTNARRAGVTRPPGVPLQSQTERLDWVDVSARRWFGVLDGRCHLTSSAYHRVPHRQPAEATVPT
jgi:hypothetical protein